MTDRLADDFLRWLSEKLASRESLSEEADRERSWLTAHQIASWWEGEPSYKDKEDELDLVLVEGWEREPERFAKWSIRPAKYPSSDMYRLWGHESIVGSRDRKVVEQRRTSPPDYITPLDVAPPAKEVFLSHSILDHKFALRVRTSLAKCGVHPWLAMERIDKDKLIFEAVRVAMNRAGATIVLLGRNALGSAWVYTESLAGQCPVVVCDGEDDEFMELLASWRPRPSPCKGTLFNSAFLERLEADYRARWDSGESAEGAQSTLARCAGGVSVDWKQRPDKFVAGASELLSVLPHHPCCVHPARPARWQGDPHFGDFATTIDAKFSR